MSYIVKSSEKTRKSGAETETKALLYLMNLRKDSEAFVEDGFTDGLYIISSDDNNKGKTIAMQSMMYAIGNEPTFPTTFDYKKYYYYIEFEENNKFYRVCRYGENFALIEGKTLLLFDSVSELKRYWTKHIFKLPEIVKNQISKIVDPVLFF